MAEVELVPCPTCWLPADLVPPGPHDDFPHARCARGHDNSLIPAVLEHLRSLAQNLPRRNPMNVTCSTCGAGSQIAEPTEEAFSAHPGYDAPVVFWKCPATEGSTVLQEDGTAAPAEMCGATNVIEKEQS